MNKKILLINLKRYGDIFQMSHLINSIKKDNPQATIDILIYEEFSRAANLINNVNKVFCINRNKLITIEKNKLYNTGIALNIFNELTNQLVFEVFDQVVNYSNDQVSTSITSYLLQVTNANSNGIYFNKDHVIQYSNERTILLNDILTSYKYTPYSFNTTAHLELNVPQYRTGKKIVFSEKYEKQSIENFEKIKDWYINKEKINPIFIGIQISASSVSKELDSYTIIDLITLYKEEGNLIPVLLLSSSKEDKELSDEINKAFNNTIINVEATFQSLPSVIKHLNMIVTPDTAIKHIADAVSVPVVEVSLGPSPIFKQGSENPKSLILSVDPSLRIFSFNKEYKKKQIIQNKLITEYDIFKATKLLLKDYTLDDFSLSKNVFLYKPIAEANGYFHLLIKGNSNNNFNLRRITSRMITNLIFELNDESSLLTILKGNEESNIKAYIFDEKTSLSLMTKNLLNVIRSYSEVKNSKSNSSNFMSLLNNLLNFTNQRNLCSLSAHIFRAKVESLEEDELTMIRLEKYLYEFKKNIQITFNTLKLIEEKSISKQLLSKQNNNVDIHE